MDCNLFDIFASRVFAGKISKAILLGCSGIVVDEGNNNYSILGLKGERIYDIFLDPDQQKSKFNIILDSQELFNEYSHRWLPGYIYSVVTTEEVYSKNIFQCIFSNAAKIITENRTIYNFIKLIDISRCPDENLDIRISTDSDISDIDEEECYYCVLSKRIFMSPRIQKLINIPYLCNGTIIPYEDAIQILAGLSII